MRDSLKILLAGRFAGVPWQGGATWAVLQYLEGLIALGHDVLLLEPVGHASLDRSGETVEYLRRLPLRQRRAALFCPQSEEAVGLPFGELRRFAQDADLLINLSGVLRDERLLAGIELRAFVDLDPCFTQLWHAQGHDLGLDLHTHFVTVGAHIGASDSQAPTCGRDWIATLPPVSLAHWPREHSAPSREAFTSVCHWRSYGSIEHDGVHYGQRAHSMRALIDIPRRACARFQLALGIHPHERADLAMLSANGWELLDPVRAASTPRRYRDFVRCSKAEICVAKSGYVVSRSGWFSDRSACYLASGRPVLAQDTGFGARLPTGEGLLSFRTAEEAAAGAAEIDAHPRRHGAAARALAEEHLDARKVLASLIERLGAAQPQRSRSSSSAPSTRSESSRSSAIRRAARACRS